MSQWGVYRQIGDNIYVASVAGDPFVAITDEHVINCVLLISRSMPYQIPTPEERAIADSFVGKKYSEWRALR